MGHSFFHLLTVATHNALMNTNTAVCLTFQISQLLSTFCRPTILIFFSSGIYLLNALSTVLVKYYFLVLPDWKWENYKMLC